MKTIHLIWLQNWYLNQCDGDWEHTFGIHIGTLDNPGWEVLIDLAETTLENRVMNALSVDVDDENWIRCHIKDRKFFGYGGACNLSDIIGHFRDWVEGSA